MRLVLFVIYIFIGATLLALPNLTRRDILFGVRVPPGFRDTEEGRRSVRSFRTAVGMMLLAGACAILFSPAWLLDLTVTLVPLLQILVAGTAFYRQYRNLKRLAVSVNAPREAELTSDPERLPWYAWLGAGAFAPLAAAALYIHANWDRIPERFPVHWGADGQPNRWAERTARGVYGPLIFGAELTAFLFVMALAGWFGSRRSRTRPAMLGLTVAIECMMGFLFAAIAVHPLLNIPIWLIAIAPMAVLIPGIIILGRKLSEPGESADPTPEQRWKAGFIYYNPADAVLFVEKRDGLGYTFNFANPWSWALLGGLALVMVSGFFVLG